MGVGGLPAVPIGIHSTLELVHLLWYVEFGMPLWLLATAAVISCRMTFYHLPVIMQQFCYCICEYIPYAHLIPLHITTGLVIETSNIDRQ